MILKKYSDINEMQFAEYIFDWEATDDKIVPSIVMKNGSNDSFEQLMMRWKELDDENTVPENMVPATLYYLVNDDEKIIGAIDFRRRLNSYLLKYGGNIGYGIKPSERKKGYGVIILKLLLEEIKGIDLNRILITCDEDNIASARIIETCGGILENVVDENGKNKKRYWINL